MNSAEMMKERRKKERNAIFEVFRQNFNAALDNAGLPKLHYGRQLEVAKSFNISPSAARKWVMGECIPDWENLILIADKLNISVDALLGRNANLQMVSIPLSVLNPSKNDNEEWITKLSNVHFEASWLESGMRLKHDDLILMVVNGDSMSPNLEHNDIIFIDMKAAANVDELEDNAIYLFKHKGRPLLRRIQLNFDETINLTCDNKQFSSAVIPKHVFQFKQNDEPEQDALSISYVGRVQWAIKRVAPDNEVKVS